MLSYLKFSLEFLDTEQVQLWPNLPFFRGAFFSGKMNWEMTPREMMQTCKAFKSIGSLCTLHSAIFLIFHACSSQTLTAQLITPRKRDDYVTCRAGNPGNLHNFVLP